MPTQVFSCVVVLTENKMYSIILHLFKILIMLYKHGPMDIYTALPLCICKLIYLALHFVYFECGEYLYVRMKVIRGQGQDHQSRSF